MLEMFLREIADHPDDLVTRRAFADWLSEQPDAALRDRGEFIAAQLELHAGTARGPRAHALSRRERELLARYQWEWTRPVRECLGATLCSFRNGMVESVATQVGQFLDAVSRGLLRL